MARNEKSGDGSTYWRAGVQATPAQRKYYSISEVAKRFGVEEHALRHWEKQVKALRPLRSSSGARLYREEDFEIIQQLKYLIIEKGLQLSVAKDLVGKEQINADMEIKNKLLEVKTRLQAIAEKIEGFLETGGKEQECNEGRAE